MNIFAKFCCFVSFPYWVFAVFPKQVMVEVLQEMAGVPQRIARTPQEMAGMPQRIAETPQEMTEMPQEMVGAPSSSIPIMLDVPDEPDLVSVFWFEQKLDHFLSTDTRTWQQRYYVNFKYYNGKGPVFLMVGGLAEIDESEIRYGAWIEYAEAVGATIYYLEHRFYGQSRPTIELNVEDLVYLNSEQALADLVWFIVNIRRHVEIFIPPTTQWIAFGASYGGTLAARLRLKYPHLIYAAVTSSSPFLEIVNFKEYFEDMEKLFDEHPGVRNEIQQAYNLIYREIQNRTAELEKKLSLCSFLRKNDKEKNISYLFWNLSYTLGYIIQYGQFELAKLKNDVIKTMADVSNSNALDRLAIVVKKILEFYGSKCLSIDYKEAIEAYKRTSWNTEPYRKFELSGSLGTRQKLYQRCTEFGQFETSDQKSGLFGHSFPLGFYVGICTDVFGKEFDLHRLKMGIIRTNSFYGGLDIEVSRVLFVNGGQDPTSILSIIKTKTDDQFAVYIENTSHCDDMRSAKYFPKLREYQHLILTKLLNWLYT